MSAWLAERGESDVLGVEKLVKTPPSAPGTKFPFYALLKGLLKFKLEADQNH